ncbi:hypothetical protein PC129_g1523 [Phytophthora cactorum]|uniref:Uncharacterized protein n=1 Tax=Phytophthora cactorum TaxID=29920 RepID=A0A8T1ITS2_9STRA|nr:hypothetical protein Pcac1_g14662 [Phytophthora cactorum]KAG3033715.1 hypothetical protein PC120_g1806 [Phytophthora cactorum]KAG3094113.1 hypothetical protein PC121_g3143 [Phytophthora cactorum]KAG3227959.1 hypothetical protein PC129_g1523 [Phytophthora cactorum]
MTRSDAAERSDRLCRLQNDPAEKSPPHPAAVDACPVTEVPVLVRVGYTMIIMMNREVVAAA